MENYELREGSGQEEWGKIGPLKEPTPSNVKIRGAADKRRAKRSGEEEQTREEGREAQQTREGAAPGRGRTEERDVDAWSEEGEDDEMEGIREAVAEAIQEAEEHATAEELAQHAAKVTTTMAEAATITQRATRLSTTIVPPAVGHERGEPRTEKTPLQRLQDALTRKLGTTF